MPSLCIGALQMDIQFENPLANCRTLEQEVRVAARTGIDVLITPEMFSTGFSMNTALVAQHSESTLHAVCDCAQRNNINIVAGYSKSIGDGRFANVAAVVTRKGDVIHEYTKTYLFSFLDEDKHFHSGKGTSSFELEGVRMAIAICYDIRFPELFRSIAGEVDAFVIPASWPDARRHHWDTLLVARAIENQAYVIGVNRVGDGGGLHFDGGSAIVSPDGRIISSVDGRHALVSGNIDSEAVCAVRSTYPFLNDIK